MQIKLLLFKKKFEHLTKYSAYILILYLLVKKKFERNVVIFLCVKSSSFDENRIYYSLFVSILFLSNFLKKYKLVYFTISVTENIDNLRIWCQFLIMKKIISLPRHCHNFCSLLSISYIAFLLTLHLLVIFKLTS